MVSTGQRVTEWTARQMTNVNRINLVNAKASTKGSFKVSGKGVKLASTRREAVMA